MDDVGLHRDTCIERLEKHCAAIQEIIDLIGRKERLVDQEAHKAKRRLGELRERFENEINARTSDSGKQAMSFLEGLCYLPALKEVFAKSIHKIKPDSIPGQEWSQILSGALLDIDSYVNQLKRL